MSAEEWRPVPGFDDYRVSSLGRVMSHKGGQPKLMRPYRSGRSDYAYPAVGLHRDGDRHVRKVHALVAEAFLGPRPDGLEVRHLNGDRFDARLLNLQYGTKSQNMLDRVEHGNHPMANKTHCKRGHEFTDENTRSAAGRRYCRACKRHRRVAAAFRAAGIEVAA